MAWEWYQRSGSAEGLDCNYNSTLLGFHCISNRWFWISLHMIWRHHTITTVVSKRQNYVKSSQIGRNCVLLPFCRRSSCDPSSAISPPLDDSYSSILDRGKSMCNRLPCATLSNASCTSASLSASNADLACIKYLNVNLVDFWLWLRASRIPECQISLSLAFSYEKDEFVWTHVALCTNRVHMILSVTIFIKCYLMHSLETHCSFALFGVSYFFDNHCRILLCWKRVFVWKNVKMKWHSIV